MKINKEAAIAHLKELGYAPGDNVYIRCIHPKQKGNAINLDKLKYSEVEKYQEQGYDIYFVVNGGGHKDQDIKACRAIFYEHDNLSKDIQRDLWQQLGLPQPTIQVDTGGKSIHSYWVLESECSAEEWRLLQTDLLEFADADRSLKNPSRILRLAGSWYMKRDEPTISQIITKSGIKYKASDLRAIIPEKVQEIPHQPSEHQVSVSIPLENCLTLSDRALIESGASNGERNAQGLKLACNLIGTANYLRSQRQQFEGDERSLFDYYCRRCPGGDGWNEKEWDAIWKSANLRNPQPSLTEEQVKNCIVAWNRKQNRTSSTSSTPEKDKIPHDDRASESQSLYKDFLARVESLLQYKDADEYKFHRSKLARNFSYRTEDIDDLIRRKLMPEDKKERRIYDLAELRDMPQFALEWLIPGFLPRGESLLFSAEAKMGKTLLSDDLIFHIITGEDDFLGVTAQTKTGRVLKISVDESVQSTVLKAEKRYGPTWLESNRVRLITDWKLTEQDFLEDQIDEFAPDLVVIDSLRQVAANIGISENSAEFVDAIASVIKLCRRKNVSLVVIHHDNKNKESQGIDRARGSSSLPAAFWGILRLDPFPITVEEGEGKQKKQVIKFDPQDTRRLLGLTARDVASLRLEIDLELENHHWLWKGESGDETGEATKIFEDRILNLLKVNPLPLATKDFMMLMELEESQRRTLHRAIEKLVAKRIINKIKGESKSLGGRPAWHYALPPSLCSTKLELPETPKTVVSVPSNLSASVQTAVESSTKNGVSHASDDNNQRENEVSGNPPDSTYREGGIDTTLIEEVIAVDTPHVGQKVTITVGDQKGKNAIVLSVYDQDGEMTCKVRMQTSDHYNGYPLDYMVKYLIW